MGEAAVKRLGQHRPVFAEELLPADHEFVQAPDDSFADELLDGRGPEVTGGPCLDEASDDCFVGADLADAQSAPNALGE